MNAKLYREYESETEIGGHHPCTYTEWLEWRVLETLVQQSLSGSETKVSSPKSFPTCDCNNGYAFNVYGDVDVCNKCNGTGMTSDKLKRCQK